MAVSRVLHELPNNFEHKSLSTPSEPQFGPTLAPTLTLTITDLQCGDLRLNRSLPLTGTCGLVPHIPPPVCPWETIPTLLKCEGKLHGQRYHVLASLRWQTLHA
ncbi:Hypothetical predicted protein [Pelobates cultripes]|uniref:Uncharacterized protein n=1 Tax=Pelobates cultripes TaxID=61616 RepID=A0AAD1WEF0_PELCU|nr:Hypothetical predicted protein [Pelobates cultripes]